VLRGETRVPFVDLRPVNLPLREELLADLAGLLERGNFVHGPEIAAFEAAFARFCGTAHCVGTSSGLDALRLGLIAAGIEPGDEVIVPANTFVATFEAVVQAGGAPVAVDVSETDYNLDPTLVRHAVTARTRFLLPVHLYGQLADMGAFLRIAGEHGLRIVEDACQAHGAERDGHRAGRTGAAAAFSFYPTKNLGAAGDAGALVTSSAEIAETARALREHGEVEKYRSAYPGYTARLDSIQAMVLSRKLPRLEGWNARRADVADFYDATLEGVGDVRLPPRAPGSTPVWHLYVVRTAHREALAGFLAERGISTARHYPEPPHLSQAFARLADGRGSFPVTESLADELLSLPLYPGIRPEQLEAVSDAVHAFFADG
jgi:dTDP-3-amino-3,4,6-trideoxy-alpha-D-glucose transaminase